MWSSCSSLDKTNDGCCKLSPACAFVLDDIPHMLQPCPSLAETRSKLSIFTSSYSAQVDPQIRSILQRFIPDSDELCILLLDCSNNPDVVCASQELGPDALHHLLYISRPWIYALHGSRLKQLGTWNHQSQSDTARRIRPKHLT